jgi:solute carrier family 25 phosphate transporter 23/24/25/41
MHISIVGCAAISESPSLSRDPNKPSDVLRRRFQINTMSNMGYQYSSILDAVRVIVAEEGVRGLFKGIAPNLLKVAPSMASSWLSFELTRDFLLGLNDRR